MGKRRKLAKQLRKRGLADAAPTLVICTGKKCAPRDTSRTLVAAIAPDAAASMPPVRLVTVGCLHVCKAGPIAATYPRIRFAKRVKPKRARKLLAKLARRAHRA